MTKAAAAFVSVVPSPYQRDLFRALAARPELDLRVFYLEAASPDSPWPEQPLADYESVLPGFWFPLGKARCHWNWRLPDWRDFSILVCNTLLTSVTGHWLMRRAWRHRPWTFWGETPGRSSLLHDLISAPLHRARAIAAIGSVAAREYHARFPEPASINIPYHCDLAPFLAQPRPAPPHRDPTFLFCGQMIARKGVDLLLEAFAQLDRGRLLLVGREAELPQLLAPLAPSVRERIEYAGFQPPQELPHFFAKADVFLLPSRHDGWGVVVNQALGAGLPILCSDRVGAGLDLVEPGVNGLRFPAGDANALAAAMQSCLDAPGKLIAWGQASRARAAAWTPEAGAGKWIDAFRQLDLL
jgi:glycosyltransferase involved in cell wall biosynthesis